MTIYRILKSIKFYWNNFFLSGIESQLLENVSKDSFNRRKKDLEITLEMPEDYFYVISFIFLINSLKENFNLTINWVKINTNYQKRGISSFFKRVPIFNRKWHKLYLENGGNILIDCDIDIFNYYKYKPKANLIFKGLTSKDELLELKYNNILIGDLIYDSYLRYRPFPTVNLKDKFLIKIIISALYITDICKTFFANKKSTLFFTSYTSYVHHGVLVRVALDEKLKVFTMGSYEMLINEISYDFPYHIKDYRSYKKDFDSFNVKFKTELLNESKKQLKNRFLGNHDDATFYMKKSAYSNSVIQNIFSQNTKRKRIVIFAHDFYDSPHVRRWMLFPDFFEWLKFVLKFSNTDDYDYFIKVHPNSSHENVIIIQKLITEINPKVKLIQRATSTLSLIKEGFDFGISNHGTIAHELPFFDIPVVNSGDNPHISFSFSYTVKSIDEFKGILKNPLKINDLINLSETKSEIYSFYAMHNLVNDSGDWNLMEDLRFINSEIRFIENLTELKLLNHKLEEAKYKSRIISPFQKFANTFV